jgi:rhodanese-related sulfurtransferase
LAAVIKPLAMLLALVVAACASPAPPPAEPTLFAVEAVDVVRAGGALLIDVREEHEKRASGVPDVPHVELPYLLDHGDDAGFAARVERALAGRRDRPVILICQVGMRSERAREVLAERGFTRVRTVVSGFQSWVDFDLPRKAAPP